jgi:hypothetical protein
VESSPNEATTFRLRFPEVVAQAKPFTAEELQKAIQTALASCKEL